jgi:hypothetical protein
MIEALIYGDRPIRIIENLSRLPPISELKKASPGCAEKTLRIPANDSLETHGTGITERSL